MNSASYPDFRRRLLAWYRRHARPLAWRQDRDPYRVWISEIMLQQTQVATVEPYFQRFMTTLPTLGDLARADEQVVLKLWEGLGYYRRARQLHAAAQVIDRQHGGQFPRDPLAVRELPGIGRYTAGAILSIAFDVREPILEANTIRLFSRLWAFRGDPQSTAGQRVLWDAAAAVLPKRGSGTLNQALMELGSQICTPREPQCPVCPVAQFCAARTAGLQQVIPRPKSKRPATDVHEAAVVIYRRGRVLLLKRDDAPRWAGLWDYPRFEIEHRTGAALDRELNDKVRALAGVEIEPEHEIAVIRHGVTRFRISLHCHQARYLRTTKSRAAGEIGWFRPSELDDLPQSSPGRKLSRIVASARNVATKTIASSS